MRVLMIHNDYSEVGGEFFSVRAEAHALLQAGIDVELLAVDNSSFQSGLSGVKAGMAAVLGSGLRSMVAKAIDEHQPDVIHVQNLFPRLGGNAIAAIGISGIPWVRTLRNFRLTCLAATHRLAGDDCFRCSDSATALPGVVRGCYRDSVVASGGALIYARKERAAENRYSPHAYLVLSESMNRTLENRLNPVPVFVRPNIIGLPIEFNDSDLRRRSGCCFVGRLTEEKGVGLMLEVADRCPDIEFSVVGVGPMSTVVRQFAELHSNFSYFGELSNDECLKLMASARTVIVPSQWSEPFGRVAAEALSVGALPVVPNYGGLREIVAGLSPNLVSEDGTAMSYARIIARIEELDEGEFFSLCVAARQHWKENYSPSAGVGGLIDIYTSVITGTL